MVRPLLLVFPSILLALELPSGSTLEVRLHTKLTSAASKPGDAFEGVVIQDPIDGAVVKGKVKTATSASDTQRAALVLEFTEIAGQPLKAQLSEVDNAREKVNDKGEIEGIAGSETLTSRIDAGLGKLGGRLPTFAEILKAAKGAAFKESDANIVYEPGAEFIVKLTAPLKLEAARLKGPPKLEEVANFQALAELANAQPFQTVADNPPKNSDITNLMFIGSPERLVAAFKDSGWSLAAGLSGKSKFETMRALVEDRGYKEAPMSILRLEGSEPLFNWEKMNNTFAKRHHLRIFRRPVQWEGSQVWVSSSTHDTGIEFKPEQKNFIHKVDGKIDGERDKIVRDLVFTGAVKSVAHVDRPAIPKETMNATGDKLVTDGRMAVVIFRESAP